MDHLQTVSITSVEISATVINMRHENLISQELSDVEMQLKADLAKHQYLKKWQLDLRVAGIKLRNWEYWAYACGVCANVPVLVLS